MKYFLFFLLSLLVISCGPLNNNGNYKGNGFDYYGRGQAPEAGMPSGPGCYAKCLIPDQYESRPIPIIEYTGEAYNDPNVKAERITIKEATSKWVKKKADKNCRSRNPDDCLVWCLIETKAEYYDYYTVTDTIANKEFNIQTIEQKEITKVGGFTEWKQVVCENQITPQLYRDLQTALIDFDYIPEIERNGNPGFSPTIKAALLKFQKDNSLPQGQLDVDTLVALGVGF